MQQAALNCEAYSYRRHEPEKEVLYQVIADNLETFFERLRTEVLAVFLRAVQGWYRTKAKEEGYTDVRGGSVSFRSSNVSAPA